MCQIEYFKVYFIYNIVVLQCSSSSVTALQTAFFKANVSQRAKLELDRLYQTVLVCLQPNSLWNSVT